MVTLHSAYLHDDTTLSKTQKKLASSHDSAVFSSISKPILTSPELNLPVEGGFAAERFSILREWAIHAGGEDLHGSCPQRYSVLC